MSIADPASCRCRCTDSCSVLAEAATVLGDIARHIMLGEHDHVLPDAVSANVVAANSPSCLHTVVDKNLQELRQTIMTMPQHQQAKHVTYI